MMKKIIFLTLLLTFASTIWAENITVDGIVRNYLVYAPSNLGAKRPLLISCHGMNQDAPYQKNMLQIESIADTAKFVTVFPNGIDKSWDLSGNRDLNFMKAIIDAMVDKYDIDRNKVYLSGFSMGGMFTYYAMNRMADTFAAFAPISGYPLWGADFTSSRPIPIIHTHGTSDDVVNFSGLNSILMGWVRRNGCPETPVVTSPYRANHITRRVWGPGENGVEVVLLELAGKGHWISNDVVKTGDEIWKFCKRFSLNGTAPSIRFTSPTSNLSFITMGGESDIPDIELEINASAPDGSVKDVKLYDGNQLLAELTVPPYSYTLKNLAVGTHELTAVVMDDEGNTAKCNKTIIVSEVVRNFFSDCFTVEGSVPEGWETFDGNENRVGFCSGFSSGSRVFHFTGSKRDFDWGLYTRNVTGGIHDGYARYASDKTNTFLTLYPGNYQLYTLITNWNQPNFSPVTVALETIDGEAVFSKTFTPSSNIGNTATNSFTGSTPQNDTFDILEKGRYRISFYTANAPWADLVIGKATIRRVGDVSSVSHFSVSQPLQVNYYNLSGQQVQPTSRGLYIEKTIRMDGSISSKVIMK